MRIVSANVYNGNKQIVKDVAKLKSLGATSLGIQEAWRRAILIRQALRDTYDKFDGSEGGRSGSEVPIYLHARTTTYLGDGAYLVSERTQPDNKGIAPDRYLVWVRFEYKGKKYCHINMHPNAAVQNRETGAPLSTGIKRVREYIKSMKALEQEIVRQKGDGYIVIVTGDLNYRVRKGLSLWKWSPAALFKRTGLDFWAEGLDYLAWDKRRMVLGKHFIIPPGQTGSDHRWLVGDLKPLGT